MAIRKRLQHTAGRRLEGDISVMWGSIQEISYNERRVLFMQAKPGGGRRNPYVIIPGYKVGEYEHTGKTTSVTVETILPADQAAVREMIQPLTEGIITFW